MKTLLAKLLGVKWLQAVTGAALAALGLYAYSQRRRADKLQSDNSELSSDLHQAELVNQQRQALAADQQREARTRANLPNRQAISNHLRGQPESRAVPERRVVLGNSKQGATNAPASNPKPTTKSHEQPTQTSPSRRRASNWLRRRSAELYSAKQPEE